MPAAFIDDYLAYLLARASHQVSGQFHEALRKRGVPVMHWRVMAALHSAPMTVKALCEVVLAQQSTVSKLLDRMVEAGLVKRDTLPQDRRSVLVSLTPKGQAQAEPLIELARVHERSVLEPFGQADARQLVDLLRRLVAQAR